MNQSDHASNVSRMSSASSRSSSIETTVTKLLMATKHLLQVLTQWSKGAVSGKGVSDAYVQLGNDFKLVSKHFTQHGIDVSDLGDVPMKLRRVLELALRETPCDETLNKYLPQIREIIVTLLDKLKTKQALLKTMKKDQQIARLSQNHLRNSSITSGISFSSSHGNRDKVASTSLGTPGTVLESQNSDDEKEKEQTHQKTSDDTSKESLHVKDTLIVPKNNELSVENSDALSQLKKGTTIQRRASKRYSAYHMAKLTSQSTSDAIAAANIPSVNKSSSNDVGDDGKFHSKLEENNVGDANGNDTEIETSIQNPVSNDSEYTLFLKVDGRTKKCTVPKLTSLNGVRLLFVERFAYSPGSETFPEIYIKDPKYSEYYELDEQNMADLKDGCVVELRSQKENSEMEKHFNNFMKQVKAEIKNSQIQVLDVINSKQNHTPAITDNNLPSSEVSTSSKTNSEVDVELIRHNLSILKQIYTTNKKATEDEVNNILLKVEQFKSSQLNADASSGVSNSYVQQSQDNLGDISENLLSRVDDLQDVIEIIRKDVADRGVRPATKRIESLLREINDAESDLKKMQNFINTEKPHWKKIWEEELDKVCDQQQFLTLQEDLITDLQEDLDRASQTFDLVKMCCEEKEKNPTVSKTSAPIIPLLKPGTFDQVREEMLFAVQSLNPDHESRKDAIKKAEKIWEKEKVYKEHDEFRDELGNFVETSALKKSGGVEAIEKQRQEKDAEILRSTFGLNF